MPYDSTEGYSGTDTSKDRAIHDQQSGAASRRQREIIRRMGEAGTHGLTWKEVAYDLAVHHGSASGSLTNLHKAGLIARTGRKRDRSKIYVLPQYALPSDRLEAYHPRNAAPTVAPYVPTGTEDWRTLRNHHPSGAYLPIGQMDGDCGACGAQWPCEYAIVALATYGFTRSEA